jgi:outer membrane protein
MAKRYLIAGAAFFAAMALCVATADALDKGTWMFRGKFVHAFADSNSDMISGLPGASVDTEDGSGFGVDVGYAITPHWNVELSISDTGHDIEGRGVLGGLGEVADFRMLPVTLTGQFRWRPNKVVSPYVGLGASYANFHNEDSKVVLVEGVATETRIRIDDDWGLAAQVGLDLFLSEHWSMNFDVKYLDLDPDADFETAGVANTTDLNVEPWVSSVGVGFRF